MGDLYLAYFGSADPTRYGVRARPLPTVSRNWPPYPMPESWYRTAFRPRTGWIAVSVSLLRLDPRYAWLAVQAPVAHVGYSIWIYHLPNESA